MVTPMTTTTLPQATAQPARPVADQHIAAFRLRLDLAQRTDAEFAVRLRAAQLRHACTERLHSL